jgi:hypothetical protein
MSRKILLTTTVDWPSAARLAGAFAQLGAGVEALFPRGHVLGVSRYPKHTHLYRPLHPLPSLACAIEAAAPDMVVPCDDRALAQLLTLTASRPDLTALTTRSLGSLDSYPLMLSRGMSIALARDAGIVAPATLEVPDENSLPKMLEEIGLPCVVKSDGSWGGGGVIVARTPDEAHEAFRKLKGPPPRWRSLFRAVGRKDMHYLADAWAPRRAAVSVQAFVPGKPATSVFACRDGKLQAALHMDVVDWQGATGPASLMRRVACPQMEEAAHRIARRFKLSGLIGLDFVRDGEGVAHLIEINPRATQICHLALGPDLPAALLGVPPRPPITGNPLIALFPQLLTRPQRSPEVYDDVPCDDPAVFQALAGDEGPDALGLIPELLRTDGEMPVFRRR